MYMKKECIYSTYEEYSRYQLRLNSPVCILFTIKCMQENNFSTLAWTSNSVLFNKKLINLAYLE